MFLNSTDTTVLLGIGFLFALAYFGRWVSKIIIQRKNHKEGQKIIENQYRKAWYETFSA